MYETIESICELFTITPFDALMAFVVFPLIFVTIWKLFEKVLFGPYLELFEAREAATSGAESISSEYADKAKKIELQYEEELLQARVSAMSAKLNRVQEATGEAARIVGVAEDEAHQKQQAARQESAESVEQLRQEVFSGADQLVEEIVTSLKQPPATADGDDTGATVQ